MADTAEQRRVTACPDDVFGLTDEWGPEKVVCVSDSRTGMRGVLVIDNTARGMGKGGTRMSPTLSIGEVARLARTMTWKWAALDLFHGGAKAGILGDPNGHDKEAVLRAFARALQNEVPREYVLGLDMGLTENDAAILRDELGDRGAAVGLPADLGGVPYDELGVTGLGVAEATDQAAQLMGRSVVDARVAIQGFGAVGAAAAQRLDELGARIVAVSVAGGAIIDPDGLDVPRLLALRASGGDAAILDHGAVAPLGEELYVPADILIPAAVQDTITDDVAQATTAWLVVEGANLPTTPTATGVLARRDVLVVPDFLANAGGIIAAAHSMDARYSAFRPDPAVISRSVATRIRANVQYMVEQSRRQERTVRETALVVAKERVRNAMALRGRLPLGASNGTER